MLFRPNPSSGVPIYLQLMEQVKHGIETGALRPGEQLPGIRPLAEELVINPNTVAKAYRELEHEGVIELRQGAGAFVAGKAGGKKFTDAIRAGQAVVADAIEKLRARGGTDEESPRVFEAEPARLYTRGGHRGWRGRHPLRRSAKELRRHRGHSRTHPSGAGRIDLRISRQKRRGQDHDDQNSARDDASDGRRGARVRTAGERQRTERGNPPPHRIRE